MTDQLLKKEEVRENGVNVFANTKRNDDKKPAAFEAPIVGESFEKYADAPTITILQRAQNDLQGSLKSQLTQQIYELIKENALTVESLSAHNDGSTKGSVESKCAALKQRYIVDDRGIVTDKRRENKIICEPSHIFDIVACAHLMNDRMTYKPLYKNLNDIYANITRDYVQKVVRYCSNTPNGAPSASNTPTKRKDIQNIYRDILPLERVHLEILLPFDGELIGGKYSHILYFRDYQSRYVWLKPLKNIKFRNLVSTIGNFLLNMPQLPLFLESSSLDRQDLFDICEAICRRYPLKVGLGNNHSAQFQLNGVEKLKHLLNQNITQCMNDWNMCVFHGSYTYNRTQNVKSDGLPLNMLWDAVPGLGKSLKAKQDQILSDYSSHSVVQIGRGLIYLEDENATPMEDEEGEFGKNGHSGDANSKPHKKTPKRRRVQDTIDPKIKS